MAITDLFKGFTASDWGSLLSSGAEAYGAYKQGKAADKIARLQIKDYEEEKKRKKKFQSNLENSYARLELTSPRR